MFRPTEPHFDDTFRRRLEDLFVWRRDVRRFRPDPVPEEIRDHLIGLAALAPSVGLSEPWRFVLVDDRARRAAIRAVYEACNLAALKNQTTDRQAAYARLKLAGLDEAPCHFAVYAEPDPAQGHGLGRRTMPETVAYSAVMALHTVWLAARSHGIGLGWVSILDPPAVNTILDVPPNWVLIGYFCMGYPQVVSDTPELQEERWEQRRARLPIISR